MALELSEHIENSSQAFEGDWTKICTVFLGRRHTLFLKEYSTVVCVSYHMYLCDQNKEVKEWIPASSLCESL